MIAVLSITFISPLLLKMVLIARTQYPYYIYKQIFLQSPSMNLNHFFYIQVHFNYPSFNFYPILFPLLYALDDSSLFGGVYFSFPKPIAPIITILCSLKKEYQHFIHI